MPTAEQLASALASAIMAYGTYDAEVHAYTLRIPAEAIENFEFQKNLIAMESERNPASGDVTLSIVSKDPGRADA